jgi:hypothetical protein
MGVENDLCVCGHDRGQHQHLLGTKVSKMEFYYLTIDILMISGYPL